MSGAFQNFCLPPVFAESSSRTEAFALFSWVFLSPDSCLWASGGKWLTSWCWRTDPVYLPPTGRWAPALLCGQEDLGSHGWLWGLGPRWGWGGFDRGKRHTSLRVARIRGLLLLPSLPSREGGMTRSNTDFMPPRCVPLS